MRGGNEESVFRECLFNEKVLSLTWRATLKRYGKANREIRQSSETESGFFYGVIVGIGMGGSFIPLISTVARWFVNRRGVMTGIVASSTGAGALIGPPVANLLISRYNWRLSYLLLGGIVFAVIVLSAQILRRDPAQVGQVAYGEFQGGKKEINLSYDGLTLNEALCTSQFRIFRRDFHIF